MKGSPNVSSTPIPPMDFMSSTLGSDLGATLLSEEDEDVEEEEERYAAVSKNLCGFEYTPGHSVDNLEGSGMYLTKVIAFSIYSKKKDLQLTGFIISSTSQRMMKP